MLQHGKHHASVAPLELRGGTWGAAGENVALGVLQFATFAQGCLGGVV